MLVSEMLSAGLVNCNLASSYKEELFEEMVQMFVREGLVPDRKAAVDALMEREAKMSTGISEGIALPHGKLEGIKDAIVAIGISKEGIEYDALDGEPVQLVVMILCEKTRPALHVELLSEVSRLLSIPDFKERLLAAKDAEEVIEVIRSEE